jgi:hypothetical protein
MKPFIFPTLLLLLPTLVGGQSSILDNAQYSWAANVGWLNWQGDLLNGARFDSQRVVSGYVWSANIGWIHLGTGVPADGVAYDNDSKTDYGVNLTPSPSPDFINLDGYAYSANTGWILFADFGSEHRPRIEKSTGRLLGYAYGANVGWIALSSMDLNLVTRLPLQPSAFVAY